MTYICSHSAFLVANGFNGLWQGELHTVKWNLSVTQLQSFAQSATFKLLSLRFNLMITFNHHIKILKSVIFEGTSFRPKNFACYAE